MGSYAGGSVFTGGSDEFATRFGSVSFLRLGEFDLDLRRQELSKAGVRVRLQGKVFQALLVLIEQPGEVITREVLRARLWPEYSQVHFDANVNTTVNKLRQALGDCPENPVYIETIPRRGYSFIGTVGQGAPPVKTRAALMAEPGGPAIPASAAMQLASIKPHRIDPSSPLFRAGLVAILLVSMLFGATVMYLSKRAAYSAAPSGGQTSTASAAPGGSTN